MMPVQATVIAFGLSTVPQETITGGRGDNIVPGFQLIFVILSLPFSEFVILLRTVA